MDWLASDFAITVDVFGTIGISVASAEPGDGLAVLAYIVPNLCGVDSQILTNTLSENPVLRPKDTSPLLA